MTDDPVRAAQARAEASGDIHAAELLADAEPAPEPEPTPTSCKWTIVDLVALAQAVVDGDVPGDILHPNRERLDEMTRRIGCPRTVHGVRTYPDRPLEERVTR